MPFLYIRLIVALKIYYIFKSSKIKFKTISKDYFKISKHIQSNLDITKPLGWVVSFGLSSNSLYQKILYNEIIYKIIQNSLYKIIINLFIKQFVIETKYQ